MTESTKSKPSNSLSVETIQSGHVGLIAKKTWEIGETIIDLSQATTSPDPDYRSIDLIDQHVIHETARYINHSCAPNTKVDQQRSSIVAIKSINPNDEITFNYLDNERQIVRPFDCLCGHAQCIKRVEKQ